MRGSPSPGDRPKSTEHGVQTAQTGALTAARKGKRPTGPPVDAGDTRTGNSRGRERVGGHLGLGQGDRERPPMGWFSSWCWPDGTAKALDVAEPHAGKLGGVGYVHFTTILKMAGRWEAGWHKPRQGQDKRVSPHQSSPARGARGSLEVFSEKNSQAWSANRIWALG